MNLETTNTSAHITSQTPLKPAVKAWSIFLNDQGSSPHTIKAFVNDMNLVATYLRPDRTVGSISTNDLNHFLDWMQKGRGVPCSPKTLARRITSIKAFFRWLHQNGVVLTDPSEKVLQKTVISPIPTVLTVEETTAVLEVANRYRSAAKPDARYYTLLALLLETGIKKSECLAISPNHIDLETPEGAILFVRYTSPQYRYKERKIPLSEDWVSAYHEYTSQYPPEERVFPWSPRRLEYLLEDLGEEAGLDKHLSFDMCRWTCALSDWQSEMEHNKIRQKLGISKIQWREVRMKLETLASRA
jgi:site-specific recombinase XerD